MKGIGTAAGAAALGGEATAQSTDTARYVVDMETTTMGEMGDMAVVHDLRDQIGYAVVRGPESAMPDGATYTTDYRIELDVPREATTDLDARELGEPLLDLQWDKLEQRVERAHEVSTGHGARLGVIDDGVLGANPDRDATHPDLPNVRADLSVNFTADRQGPGPLGDDHGTHVAGTAAAADNETGVVGVAPNAEIVDLRVFSGVGANTGDVLAAIVVGSSSTDETYTFVQPPNEARGYPNHREVTVSGAGCDVLNLSLGTAPLVPVEVDDPEQLPELPPPFFPIPRSDLHVLLDAYEEAAAFALERGRTLVASAGNDAVNLDHPMELPGGGQANPVVLPAEAEGFLSVAAAGPIGYGWPAEEFARIVEGITVEVPIETELPTEEPAFYSNHGASAVDVSAGGGNADLDALDAGLDAAISDLVLATGFDPVYEEFQNDNPDDSPDDPANGGDGDGEVEDEVPDAFVPSYVYKAGTSFSAPNVAGLATLLAAADGEASPGAIRHVIERFARPLPVGRAGESTAPALTGAENEATDGDFDGDEPSSPGTVSRRLDPDDFRGEGHIDVPSTVAAFVDTDDTGSDRGDDGGDDDREGNDSDDGDGSDGSDGSGSDGDSDGSDGGDDGSNGSGSDGGDDGSNESDGGDDGSGEDGGSDDGGTSDESDTDGGNG